MYIKIYKNIYFFILNHFFHASEMRELLLPHRNGAFFFDINEEF